ncbi:hypothetical protein L5515_008661 [Caenorhabditis briggsae]|uniref:Uncharacterized protein n=1 Tax=Caenorhabditis briggsae TaxID=6238 RepID=A0AAE9JL77_CAEBR|nr:hypothetical protein L3Y34_008821 [Caenorhabditis briggsae]UMM36547.1 hypothetical protein L5515_008661 [Caenorhabditis briggsae]
MHPCCCHPRSPSYESVDIEPPSLSLSQSEPSESVVLIIFQSDLPPSHSYLDCHRSSHHSLTLPKRTRHCSSRRKLMEST